MLYKAIVYLASKGYIATVETRIKEPTFLGLLKDLICCFYNPYIRDGKCEFDKNMQRLYIYNSYIFSYHLFYF